jgi:hypothetical protein
MSKNLFFIFLFFCLSFINARYRTLNEDCDLFHTCDNGLRCLDYRCQVMYSDSKDNRVKWGTKCDWFHHCGKGKKCKQHRCIQK